MIKEFFTYLLESPVIKSAKTFNHLAESIAISSRQKRCRQHWHSHRLACKKFILEEMQNISSHHAILILGSGPLHEIPIEELSLQFKEVVLVDIVHLKATKKKVAHLKNVHFIEHDISELEHDLMDKKRLTIQVPSRFLDREWGMVISANILSQIPLHLNSYLKKNLPHLFTENEIEHYLKMAQINHLEYLKRFNGRVLLISDTQTQYYNLQGKITETDETLAHLRLPPAYSQWIWDVAPIPEFQKDVAIKMHVCAFVLK